MAMHMDVKLHINPENFPREIYASGGGLLVASINAPHLVNVVNY